MPTSLAVGKQPLRLGCSPSMARRECGRCASRRNAGRHCAKESSHLAKLLPSALPPPTLWPRREVVAEAHEFRRLMPVEWTGIYFGVNAGYGWASGSSNTVFGGGLTGGTTTPLGLGATELGVSDLSSSSRPRGGIAGGQIGFNWQAGRVVFGAELDAQWSGQQSTASVVCNGTPPCAASETVKIRSLTTGRARFGLAFDWLCLT